MIIMNRLETPIAGQWGIIYYNDQIDKNGFTTLGNLDGTSYFSSTSRYAFRNLGGFGLRVQHPFTGHGYFRCFALPHGQQETTI